MRIESRQKDRLLHLRPVLLPQTDLLPLPSAQEQKDSQQPRALLLLLLVQKDSQVLQLQPSEQEQKGLQQLALQQQLGARSNR